MRSGDVIDKSVGIRLRGISDEDRSEKHGKIICKLDLMVITKLKEQDNHQISQKFGVLEAFRIYTCPYTCTPIQEIH